MPPGRAAFSLLLRRLLTASTSDTPHLSSHDLDDIASALLPYLNKRNMHAMYAAAWGDPRFTQDAILPLLELSGPGGWRRFALDAEDSSLPLHTLLPSLSSDDAVATRRVLHGPVSTSQAPIIAALHLALAYGAREIRYLHRVDPDSPYLPYLPPTLPRGSHPGTPAKTPPDDATPPDSPRSSSSSFSQRGGRRPRETPPPSANSRGGPTSARGRGSSAGGRGISGDAAGCATTRAAAMACRTHQLPDSDATRPIAGSRAHPPAIGRAHV